MHPMVFCWQYIQWHFRGTQKGARVFEMLNRAIHGSVSSNIATYFVVTALLFRYTQWHHIIYLGAQKIISMVQAALFRQYLEYSLGLVQP